jgi:hypothetical protein
MREREREREREQKRKEVYVLHLYYGVYKFIGLNTLLVPEF